MKKAFCIILIILFVVPIISYADEFSILDGIKFGITEKDVAKLVKDKDSLYINNRCAEFNVFGIPYTRVFFIYSKSGIKDFSKEKITSFSDINQYIFKAHSVDNAMKYLAKHLPTALTIERWDLDNTEQLIQIMYSFTSDAQYSNEAINIYNQVEEILTEQYGDTRYTARRNESLPYIVGYDKAISNITKTHLPLTVASHRHAGLEVLNYSQRIVSYDDYYVIISHAMTTFDDLLEGEEEFSHFVIFSQSPYDISN